MADWDVIAKQRLTEDWSTLRSAYLPLNQAMRRNVEFLEKGKPDVEYVRIPNAKLYPDVGLRYIKVGVR